MASLGNGSEPPQSATPRVPTSIGPSKLEALAENLWRIAGPTRKYRRRSMTIARRSDDRLVIHDAIALGDEGMDDLEKLGRLTYILVTKTDHRLDAPAYKRRFPKAQVFAPRGVKHALEKVVEVAGIHEDLPPDECVRFETLHGVTDTGAMVVRSMDGITIVLDERFDMEGRDRTRSAFGYFATLLGSVARSNRRVSRVRSALARFATFSFVNDKRALREDLERYAEDPELVRLVVAHETIARGADAARVLREAATLL